MKALCTKKLKNKYTTFKKGEVYRVEKINNNWYLVEAVGVSCEDFNNYFNIQ